MNARIVEIRSALDARREMERIGVDPAGAAIMAPKALHLNILVEGLKPAAANILKQDALALGAEAAVSKGAAACSIEKTDAIISGTIKQIGLLAEKLRFQPYGLSEVSAAISRAAGNAAEGAVTFRAAGFEWEISDRPLVMGVVNVTPDSFFAGSRAKVAADAIEAALKMADEGADIIDLGGESSRPGAAPVDEAEELSRVVPVVEALAKNGVAVSVDTVKARVAEASMGAGAAIINDISAMTRDAGMAKAVRSGGAGVILMHMRGTPENMQTMTSYEDMTTEVYDYLAARVEAAAEAGIEAERIAVDPGIGFAKTAEAGFEIISRLKEFRTLGRPVVAGASRKSFIGSVTGGGPEDRLIGTVAAEAVAVFNGASIIRAHDVKEALDAVLVSSAIKRRGKEATAAKKKAGV